jgi:hypothetical protein
MHAFLSCRRRPTTPTTPTARRRRKVNTQCDIPNHAILHIHTVQSFDLNRRIPAINNLASIDTINSVRSPVDLGMAGIRLERHDLLTQVLVEEKLAGGNDIGGDNGAVGADTPVRVGLDVDTIAQLVLCGKGKEKERGCALDGPFDIETWKYSLHLHDPVGVRGPHAAEPCGAVGVKI